MRWKDVNLINLVSHGNKLRVEGRVDGRFSTPLLGSSAA